MNGTIIFTFILSNTEAYGIMDSIEGTDKKLGNPSVNAERDSRSHEDQEMTESRALLGSDDASWVVVVSNSNKTLTAYII
jgi:hypothetical protein